MLLFSLFLAFYTLSTFRDVVCLDEFLRKLFTWSSRRARMVASACFSQYHYSYSLFHAVLTSVNFRSHCDKFSQITVGAKIDNVQLSGKGVGREQFVELLANIMINNYGYHESHVLKNRGNHLGRSHGGLRRSGARISLWAFCIK